MRTKQPLSVSLGPGILEEIFDGIQRPLEVIAKQSKSVFVPRGVDVQPLNTTKKWDWRPEHKMQIGTQVTGGDILGYVFENSLFKEHRIMVPPGMTGTI